MGPAAARAVRLELLGVLEELLLLLQQAWLALLLQPRTSLAQLVPCLLLQGSKCLLKAFLLLQQTAMLFLQQAVMPGVLLSLSLNCCLTLNLLLQQAVMPGLLLLLSLNCYLTLDLLLQQAVMPFFFLGDAWCVALSVSTAAAGCDVWSASLAELELLC